MIEPGLESIRILPQRRFERGELHDETTADFPQLLIAPMLLSVTWTGLFERFQHFDVEAMAPVYFSHIAGVRVANSLWVKGAIEGWTEASGLTDSRQH